MSQSVNARATAKDGTQSTEPRVLNQDLFLPDWGDEVPEASPNEGSAEDPILLQEIVEASPARLSSAASARWLLSVTDKVVAGDSVPPEDVEMALRLLAGILAKSDLLQQRSLQNALEALLQD